MEENNHPMCTRSKKKGGSSPDDLGNLKDFIDYECDEPFDQRELDKELLPIFHR